MNYYERHLGDYMKNCSHLTLLEHGIYVRLLDVYYTREEPLPETKVARLIRAETLPETEALQNVLEEFFELIDSHWHQERADTDIAAYKDGEPEREVKKANENNRLRKHRQERAELFKHLTDAGHHAAWNLPIADLRTLVKNVCGDLPETPETLQATETATLATATHKPLTINQSPIPITSKSEGELVEPQKHLVGNICAVLKIDYQITDVNPANPTYRALIESGATLEEFKMAATHAKEQGKAKFAWIVARVKGQRQDAANLTLHKGALPARGNQRDAGRSVAAKSIFKPEHTKHLQGNTQPTEIEITGEHHAQLK